MALAFLPSEHIIPMFNKLRDAITQETDLRLVELVDYVETNWI